MKHTKKWIAVLLVLVLLLSLCARGKKAALTDLLECPTDSLEDAEAFLKDAGLEIKSSTAQYVTLPSAIGTDRSAQGASARIFPKLLTVKAMWTMARK